MIDVNELVGRCREHLTMSKFLRKDHLLDRANEDRALAADALETLAGEVKDLEAELECVKKQREDYFSEYRKKLTEYTEMKIALAKLAPVVEAARVLSDGDCVNYPVGTAMGNLRQALATLEAAHD